ncbi:permease [Archaeoglobus sp.]
MKGSPKDGQRGDIIKDLMFLGFISIVAIVLLLIFPDRQEKVITTSWDFFVEMISILPAVMLLMGLFTVFVSRETVVRYLGKNAGIKGTFLAIIMGALPTGPLYIAFPIASALLKKGARISNVIVFLTAWSCIKLPQELVELEFLGFRFMLVRLVLTVIFAILMGLFIEWTIELWDCD